MSLIDVTILTAALVNLVFSATVYLHSRRELVETVFAAFAFSVSVWALSTFLMTSQAVSFEVFKAGAMLHYLSGNLVFLCLLWFSVFFPSRINRSLHWPTALSAVNAIILFLIVFTPFLFVSFEDARELAEKIVFAVTGYVILSVVTIVMFGLSQVLLVRKFLLAAGEQKTQIGGIILGTSVAGSLGILTNLILPGFGNFSLFYLGPIVTTPLFVGVMAYAIIKYNLFNLRVITAEMFTALLMIALAAELFLANTSVEASARGVVFVVAGVFGFFLIRSVYREIKARAEIERLNRTMSEFLAIASHQIRSPLTHIKAALSLVKEGSYGPVDTHTRPVLNNVYLSTERLIRLVNDLLDISRMEAGKMQYVFADFDFMSLLNSVVGEFEIPAKEKGVKIFWQKKTNPLVVRGDREKLRQVVFNLVDNALKYTSKGVIEVRVVEDEGAVELQVQDSGIGMTQETLGALFKKFARGTATGTRTEGTGLGLYVAKQIIDDHGGGLWAESKGEGRGSTFHLKLLTKTPEKGSRESSGSSTRWAKAA